MLWIVSNFTSNNTRTEMKIFETLDDNIVLIDGVKYQKVEEPKEEPKSLYNILLDDFDVDDCEIICHNVENWLPPDDHHDGEEYQLGWNACLEYLRDKIK